MRIEKIGNATLYLGDAREILPSLTPAAHIITDPPYSERTHSGHDAVQGGGMDSASREALGYSSLSPDDCSSLADIFSKGCTGWIVWMTDHTLAPTIEAAMQRNSRYVFAPLPYIHPGRSVRLTGDGPSSWTDWLIVSRTTAQSKWGTLRGGYVANQGWNDKVRMGGKPTRLMQMVVSDYSRAGDLVCDPFMGAGTTGVACMKEGRKFIGIEIDQAAFDISCKRIEDAQRQADLFIS
jgi:site-specific DNA-methyltransferase (adenine-specific)